MVSSNFEEYSYNLYKVYKRKSKNAVRVESGSVTLSILFVLVMQSSIIDPYLLS